MKRLFSKKISNESTYCYPYLTISQKITNYSEVPYKNCFEKGRGIFFALLFYFMNCHQPVG